ncbi:MAG: Lrp/AsnC family transcriptional regulator [Clostridia bacterium]|nr:Lrp/AsnC family transcriptional regulator [Clostridia bacterium]
MKKRLLQLLQENCRYSNEELAAMLGVTETEIASAVSEFEKAGIIRGYNALINWEKVEGSEARALIELRVSPKKDKGFDEVAERIMAFDEVEGVYLMAGDYDLAVFVKGSTIQDIAMFVARRLSPLDSVLSADTHFILTKYKSNMTDMQNLSSYKDERECMV